MISREPTPRYEHAAVGVGDKLFVWAGRHRHRSIEATTLENFNISALSWEQPQQLKGSLLNGLEDVAVASDGENFYTLGRAGRNSALYEINCRTFLCKELLPNSPSHAPQEKEGGGMVYYGNKIVVYGGLTGRAYSDDLHVFDLEKREWTVQPTTGEKPPPLCNHTFTKIDHYRAVMFGGSSGPWSHINDTYVLNMETWHWTKLVITGDQPRARNGHAACCIAGPITGQHLPVLMVIGGEDYSRRVFGDMWLLDVDKGVWSEVTVCVAITRRYRHSAVAFGCGTSFRVVVLFGGANPLGDEISATTLLLLELSGGSWQVTRVVKPDELERPDESLREQMKKLELSPREGRDMKQTPKEEEVRRVDVEYQVSPLEHQVAELQITAMDDATSHTTPSTVSPFTHTGEENNGTMETDSAAPPTAHIASTHTNEGRETDSGGATTAHTDPPSANEGRETDSAGATTAHTDPPPIDERKTGEKEIESAATTAAPTGSTHSGVEFHFSDLDINKERKLGKGGFGDVYEGNWKKGGGMKVAVKVLRGSTTLPQEIKVLRSLPRHQNIIQLIGVATDDFNVFVVTKLAMNGSLFDYLHIKKNTPPESQSLAWALEVAHGMKHLHDHSIMHRDLKSANVLLTREWVVKLCDFGTARELTHAVTTTEQAGTYRWMSPEIMRKATARINEKCDLFSYGMILYELFAHKIPYAELDDDVDVLLSVINGKRPPVPPTLPLYLHDLLKSCWEEDPHLRPTFDDFVNKIVLTKSE